MEMFSESFIREVKDILENPSTTTLTTIPVARAKPIPFVEEIRNRKDSVLYQVMKCLICISLFLINFESVFFVVPRSRSLTPKVACTSFHTADLDPVNSISGTITFSHSDRKQVKPWS